MPVARDAPAGRPSPVCGGCETLPTMAVRASSSGSLRARRLPQAWQKLNSAALGAAQRWHMTNGSGVESWTMVETSADDAGCGCAGWSPVSRCMHIRHSVAVSEFSAPHCEQNLIIPLALIIYGL